MKDLPVNRLDKTTISEGDLTRKIEQLITDAGVTGLGITVFNNREPVYSHAFGYANYPGKTPLTPSTVLYGASFSKAVFTYTVMQFVDAKTLDLDKPLTGYLAKPLSDYVPPIKKLGYQDLAGDRRLDKITARMCLSHTTGFPNWRWFEPDKKLKFKFEPGTRYSYSGEGLYLLQFVLEQITHRDLESMAKERVFRPLRMVDTSYVWQERYQNRFARGHLANNETVGFRQWQEPSGAGSLCTTLGDYSLFFTQLLQQKGLSQKAYQTMWTPQVRIRSKKQFGPDALIDVPDNDAISLGYGLGFGLFKTPYGTAFFKEGHDEGWGHYSVGFPQKGIGVVIMTNSDRGESVFRDLLAVSIADTFTPWNWEDYIPFTPARKTG